MFIRVKLYGTLRRLSQTGTPGLWEGEVPDLMTVEALLEHLGAAKYEANAAAINGEPCELIDSIPPNSVVTLVTPMGGG
jgi:sulfur carrier protein ThiS